MPTKSPSIRYTTLLEYQSVARNTLTTIYMRFSLRHNTAKENCLTHCVATCYTSPIEYQPVESNLLFISKKDSTL